jgi:hypothetical protein
MRSLAMAIVTMSCAASCSGEDPRRAGVSRPAPPRVLAAPQPVLASSAEADPRRATRRAAHDALAEHCGACHEGHRPTAVAKALAVFDLDRPDWPSRFTEQRFETALRRLAKAPPASRDAFLAFRDAERAAVDPVQLRRDQSMEAPLRPR